MAFKQRSYFEPVTTSRRCIIPTIASVACVFVLATSTVYAGERTTAPIFGLDFEEDWFAGTDRYYTTGIRLTLSWADAPRTSWIGRTGAFLRSLFPLPQGTKDRPITTLGLATQYYTPTDASESGLGPGERPFAGWLYVGGIDRIALLDKNSNVVGEDIVEVQLGVVGPHAYSGDLQTWFHTRIWPSPVFTGWPNQIHDEPGALLRLERRWKLSLTKTESLYGVDVWPQLSTALGNVRTQLEGGAIIRLGYNLPERPPLGSVGPAVQSTPQGSVGTNSNVRTFSPWSVYATASFATRAVFRNIFLDGNSFQDSARVDRRWWVTDTSLGFYVQYREFSLGYQWITRSKEFFGQEASQQYGTVSITAGTRF